MRKHLISFAQVIKFCKISSSRGGFNPKTTPLRTPLVSSDCDGTNRNCYQCGHSLIRSIL